MKFRLKKRVVILFIIMIFSATITGCGRGYSISSALIQKAVGRYYLTGWLLMNKPFSKLTSVRNETDWGGFTQTDGLTQLVTGTYYYKLKKHRISYNLASDEYYTDDLVEYANEYTAEYFKEQLGISDEDDLVLTFEPDYFITTTSYRNPSYKYEDTVRSNLFPSSFTKEDVENYVLNSNSSNINDCYIISSKSCLEYESILDFDKYLSFRDHIYSITLYCNDGFVEYVCDSHDRYIINSPTDEDPEIYDYNTDQYMKKSEYDKTAKLDDEYFINMYQNKIYEPAEGIKIEYYDTYKQAFAYDPESDSFKESSYEKEIHDPDEFNVKTYGNEKTTSFTVNVFTECDIAVKNYKHNKISVSYKYDNKPGTAYNKETLYKFGEYKYIGYVYEQNRIERIGKFYPDEGKRFFMPSEYHSETTVSVRLD
ncbi:hypothetical protein [Butyrivibrio sp. MC2021]|uniref:hypothetical protein n=1 Tax=Butyrivibrio sp. MC2021 TaxID=1408306 RepID=UPI00047CFD34|nr:hypothetical protein [Butyrivibrio sp. MC2021]